MQLIKRLGKFLVGIGPGIMAIGFTIGTGSVTSMLVAGSRFGMQLLWVLLLSCIFSWVLMEAYGRFALVTGYSALNGIKKNIKFGNILAIFIILGISFGQMNSLIGILGITSNAIFEVFSLFFPSLHQFQYSVVLGTAILIIAIFYYLIWKGSYTVFEKVLLIFVVFLGLSFIGSFFIMLPTAKEIGEGLIPSIPNVSDGKMLVAAFVGTTMASATFISRPLFTKSKGWDVNNLSDQRKDAIWAAVLIFIISASIMGVATKVLFHNGKVIEKVIDMVYTLEPVVGRMAVVVFFLGILSAGLSSIFPILMIAPMMIADYKDGELNTQSNNFKIIAAISCLIGLTGVIVGGNPIKIQILTQVFNVFILPMVIVAILILINSKRLMAEHKAGLALNFGLILSLLFALIISYNGMLSIL